ncbi:MAG: SDR family NAD(P)-dependent oxidoreductase, partial [Alphaproteobacteria bacterium]
MAMLQDRVALVTAAGGGIAGAIARRFGAEGAAVCCVDIDADTAGQTARDIEAAGGSAEARQCDVSSET